ncbi:AAA family ATPase [Paenibacillus sp. GCM10023248]|nr:ATP-binding protein [Paenibacillus sp. MAHUQ-63]
MKRGDNGLTTKKNIRLPKSKGIETASVYTSEACKEKIKHFVLPDNNRQIIEEFIAIQGMKPKFEEAEVPLPNKVVMFGTPGTGKTLTAYYLAHRLDLPLIIVRLDAIIHSHLGETGSNIRKIFEYAKLANCVLFFDEFDALARARDSIDEVKEMARVVNTLLQCLDEFNGDSIFLAATNLQEELDYAIWRRFDTRMTYEPPKAKELHLFLAKLLGDSAENLELIETSIPLLQGSSYAEIEQIILKAKRTTLIQDCKMSYDTIVNAYNAYNPAYMKKQLKFAVE